MKAVYKKELHTYLTTPIGYIFVAIYFLVSGALFSLTTLMSMTADVAPYFTYMLLALAILLPLLTMKAFSEERKQRTEQLLMSAPVSITGFVLGKFLAAMTLYSVCLCVSCLPFFLLYRFAVVKTAVLFGNLLALWLVGAAFVAVGLFVSSLTENQLAAAVGSVGILMGFLGVSLLNSFIGSYPIRFLLSSISIFSRFQNFAQGVFDFAALFYYLSVCGVFLFLTVRVFDRRRFR